MRQRSEAMRGHFQQAAEQGGFTLSPAQSAAVERLSRVAGELASSRGLFRSHTPRSLYVWACRARQELFPIGDHPLAGLPEDSTLMRS